MASKNPIWIKTATGWEAYNLTVLAGFVKTAAGWQEIWGDPDDPAPYQFGWYVKTAAGWRETWTSPA